MNRKSSTYNTCASPVPGCILTASSSDELFNLSKQEYVSDNNRLPEVRYYKNGGKMLAYHTVKW